MTQKEKTYEPITHPAGSGEPESDDLAMAQAQMNALLAAGDAAITAALSKDSAAFLSANQQRGAQ